MKNLKLTQVLVVCFMTLVASCTPNDIALPMVPNLGLTTAQTAEWFATTGDNTTFNAVLAGQSIPTGDLNVIVQSVFGNFVHINCRTTNNMGGMINERNRFMQNYIQTLLAQGYTMQDLQGHLGFRVQVTIIWATDSYGSKIPSQSYEPLTGQQYLVEEYRISWIMDGQYFQMYLSDL